MAIDFITKYNCTGCGACNNICPVNAITMELNKDGFYEPNISSDRCVECETCRNVCPVNHPIYNNTREPETYAVMADDEIRLRSSSGGIFELLAREILKRGGYVCGVSYKDDYTTEHIIINKKADLKKIQGSKYVMSDVGNVYREIKDLLEKDKYVLFSGCPCQVAGLNGYLRDKADTDQLICVDLICHGIPSVKAFKKYLKDVHGNRKMSHVGFKDKEYGWHASMTIDFEDGTRFNEPCEKDFYFWSYLSGVNKNAACGECVFAKIPRQGDITIGDYWGISNYNKELNDGKGTSVVLTNNEKGAAFWKEVIPKTKKCINTPLGAAVKGNANLIKSPHNHISRNQFFKNIDSKRYPIVAPWSYGTERFDIGLVGIPTYPNFGGALTYYALYKALTDMGYTTTIISRPRSSGRPPIMPEKVYEINPYPSHALKLEFKDKDAMFAMNEVCDTFVVGSDQLFNADLYYVFGEIVTLDWVTDRHRKVAYAASFGHNVFWGNENQRAKMAHYMKKFDAFSMREEEGIELAKNSFGVKAEWVLDPVFLCDKSHYEKIAENTAHKNAIPHIFAYVLDPDENKNQILNFCRRKTGLEIELYSEMLFNPTKEALEKAQAQFEIPLRQAKIEERLYSLKNSDLIIADSFHGICFAIIFEIPFIAILNTNRGASRFYTLLSKLHLTSRLITSVGQLKENKHLLSGKMDFTESRDILYQEKLRCLAWLKKAISPENETKKAFSSVDIINEKIRALKKDGLITEIKMNALISGKMFMRLSDLKEYLDMLNKNKEQLTILISVKDTPGFELKKEIDNKIRDLGAEISLVDKHWKSYVLVLDAGKVILEVISKKEERVAYTGVMQGKSYKVVSRSYRQGNVAAAIIDGTDYAENRRGLNIVVVDRHLNEVIDTVAFDTHMPGAPCYRFGKLCKYTVKPEVKDNGTVPREHTPGRTVQAPEKPAAQSQINRENEQLLHNAMVVAAGGGCTLDYYVDKGIKRIAIYGNDMLAAYLWEQAYYKELEVVHLLSDRDRELDIRFPRPGKIKFSDINKMDLSTVNVPVIVAALDIPKALAGLTGKVSVEKIGELNRYSNFKRFLFDGVKAYKKRFPELKIALLNMIPVWEVKNRTEQEKHLLAGDPKRDLGKIKETVFKRHGYDDGYIKDVWSRISIVNNNGVNFVADKEGKYVNAVNGYRVTTDIPSEFLNTVYMFGNSLCYGVGVQDEYTIGSVLQREMNAYYKGQSPYAVLNCGNGGGLNCHEQWKSFEYHAPQNGDIAVFIMNYGKLLEEVYKDDFIWCNASQVFDRPHNMGEIFFDADHVNYLGNEACGKLMSKTLIQSNALEKGAKLKSLQLENVKKARKSNWNLSEQEIAQLNEYLENLKKVKRSDADNEKIGSIVMNCNPFTLGHRYLIEESSKKCDWLYIFVVEEDQSVFPFSDRYELVKKGTADLKNVTVIPSGKFIISQVTFQAYFKKEEKKDVVIDASGDINIFAAKIAPALGISIRFAGEEPLDKVTNQYNATMKRILPRYGISFEVISRKELLGAPISASRVRALLSQKAFDEIRQIVPATTYEYLYKRFSDSKQVLVLGGTRFMGIRLVKKLVEKNHFVTIATRGIHKDDFGKSVTRIVYDRLNPESVKKNLSGKHYDIIIDTSAYSSNAVKNVLEYVSCEKYVQVSSTAVYAKHMLDLREEMMDTEKIPFEYSDSEKNYGLGKRYAESVALQVFPQYDPTIVRIPFVVEPDNLDNKELNLRLYFYAVHIVKQIPMNVDNEEYCCSFVRTFDEADFLIYMAEATCSGVYNFSAEGYVKVKDIIKYIEVKSGKKAVYSENGDMHPFRKEHFGGVGYSFNLEKAKGCGFEIARLDDWLWKLLDSYINLLQSE